MHSAHKEFISENKKQNKFANFIYILIRHKADNL